MENNQILSPLFLPSHLTHAIFHALPSFMVNEKTKVDDWGQISDIYSQTRSSVPVANELMNSFTEK